MEKELQELEASFIRNDNLGVEQLKDLVRKVMRICSVDKNGFVIINPDWTTKLKLADKILLVIGARFLANKLQEAQGKTPEIVEEVTLDELEKILQEKRPNLTARLKELRDENLISTSKKSTYLTTQYAVSKLVDKTIQGGQ